MAERVQEERRYERDWVAREYHMRVINALVAERNQALAVLRTLDGMELPVEAHARIGNVLSRYEALRDG